MVLRFRPGGRPDVCGFGLTQARLQLGRLVDRTCCSRATRHLTWLSLQDSTAATKNITAPFEFCEVYKDRNKSQMSGNCKIETLLRTQSQQHWLHTSPLATGMPQRLAG